MNLKRYRFANGILPVMFVILILLLTANHAAAAIWPTAGDWPIWGGQPANITPVSWPGDASWVSYTALGSPLADPSVADPSNGGTSPQNYVSVTSNCPDKTLPSVYWYYDSANQMIFFRFRLSAIPNTYATGPNPGSTATTDPWRSAQWSVLIDIDGDGYREFALQLDGSTGGPGNPVDRLAVIYSATQDNGLDYTDAGSGIFLVNQFPTAFVNVNGGTTMNFHNSNSPDTTWANGNSESQWDYGMTRCTDGSTPGCTEYIADYQIPLAMLDATGVGGPAVTENTSMSFLFATANSLQNPFQKDVVTTGDEVYIGDPTLPAPFGDPITLGGGPVPNAVIIDVAASGCGPTSLSATVNDTLIISGGTAVTSVASVDFYYYADDNANGIEDDGNTWTLVGAASTDNDPVGQWTATWDSTTVPQGNYLIGAVAVNSLGNITYSYAAPGDIPAIGASPPNYANPTDPGQVLAVFSNTCGAPPPYAVKTNNAAGPVAAGGPVTYTVTVFNTTGSAITVSTITDNLPAGFAYQSTGAGTLGAPDTSPNPGDGGTLTWTFPPASVPAGSNRTLIYTCNASAVAGTYSNTASAVTSAGTLNAQPSQVSVGAPQLTVTKSASSYSVTPGDPLTYTITYTNTSPVNVTGAAVSDALPDGFTYVSNTGGGVYTAGTHTIDWTIGVLAAGDSGTLTVTGSIEDPFPTDATIPMENTANLTSNESAPTSATTSVMVDTPRPILSVQKSAASATTPDNTDVTFTIDYANTGDIVATGVTLTDVVPAGLTFVSATGGGTESGGTVTWNLPDLAANSTASVTVTFNVPNGYAGDNPFTNTVSLSATGIASVNDSFEMGVNQTTDICSTYYFYPTTADVGFDGIRPTATTAVPAGAGTNTQVDTPADQSYVEGVRFYTDPATTNAVNFSGDLTTNFYLDRTNGGGIAIQTNVYDYDSATGNKVLLGTDEQLLTGSSKGALAPFTVTLAGTLAKGHRLLWIYNIRSRTNQANTVYLQYGGTVTNPISGGTVNADSNAAFCVSPPANLVIDKQVDNLTASPGDTLIYTILFSNTGQTNATGAQVTDSLPTGVTYVGATLNGGAAPAPVINVRDYTFTVNSSDTGNPGQVSGGQGGSLVITCTVDSPLDAGITEVENSASLVSTQTVEVTDTASTAILTPELSVSQTADLTLVGPGDTVTYTFTIINSGPADATNVTLNDVLPVTGYYTYVPGSTTLNGAPAADNVAGGTLDFNIGTLAAGETAVVTIQMVGGAAATFPAVQTNLDSTATATNSETSGSVTSNTVTVTVNPLPNLTISKSFNPAGPYSAGDLITCEITVSNIGGADALGVTVSDNIPAYTSYQNGTLMYNGGLQTDVPGDDTGSYDGSGSRAVFQVGTLTPGTTRDMSFVIVVDNPMPAGTTPLSNTVQVTAANAAAKSDTITDSITADPTLTLTKTGPASSPFPAATATASSTGTSVQVDDVTPFVINQYILVNGNDAKITGISGSTLTVDTALTVTNGDDVTGSISYSIQYGNGGTANATGTTLVDTLPAGATYITSTGGGVYAAGPNQVTWNIGTLPVGDSGVVKVFIFPGAAGNATNSATITAAVGAPATDSVTTGVGGLRIGKSTSTPSIQSGNAATYAIQIQNTAPATATGIVVTDTLAPGFTYGSTVSITGGTRTATSDPTVGDQVPSWGTFSLNSNETMTITFQANTGANIEGTYDNELSVTSTNTSAGNFDPLLTTAEDVTVSAVASPPPTGSLASAGDISVGCTATLNWTAANATSGTLNPGGIAVSVAGGSGSINVNPTSTTVYTLQLTGPGGTVSYNATQTVNPAPSITAFDASPSTIGAGDAVTFSATFTGGTGEITPGNYAITSGGTYVLNPGPGSSTTYTLTVTAPCGAASTDTATATVSVGSAPSGSLASAGDISLGCDGTLNWTAANATSGTLNPGGISVPVGDGAGNITVTPTTTTTYTLELTGPGGTTNYNATINVAPAPVISTFTASPTSIDAGDSVTFSATYTGGTGVITPGGFAIASGGTYVLNTGPSTSTTYTLTVTAPCGAASLDTASVTVAVGNAPSGSLTSSGDISLGCSATLSWTATNATSGTLNPGGISIPAGDGTGSVTVTPTATTTYTLELTGAGGTTSYNVTVAVSPAPVIASFTASPTSINAGDSVTFSATYSGGTGIITPGNYAITSGGTYLLNPGPTSSTTYTLTVIAPCGAASQASASVSVSVSGGSPPTGSLIASPGEISAGCSATLDWTAADATSGTITPGGISLAVADGSGSVTVTPTTTTTYTLELTGPDGTASYTATVTVNPKPQIDSFTVSPATIPQGGAVTLSASFSGGTGVITPGNYDIDPGATLTLDPGPDATTTYTLTVTAPCGSASRATATATVRVIENRLDALKSVSDVNGGNLRPGEVLLYTITIISSNDEDLGGVTFSDAIPANTAYVEGSAVGPAGSTATVAGGVVQVTGITVPARGLVMIMFKVKLDDPLAPGVTAIYNQGVVNYDKNGDGENDTEALTDGNTVVSGEQETALPITAGPNLSDTVKSGELVIDNNNDGVVSPGDTIRYRIDIINSGDEDALGVTFYDPIPADTDFVTGSITASKGTASFDANANQVQWSGDVAMGETVTIGFDVIVHTGIRVGTVISNQGFVSYDSDGDGTSDTTLATDGDLSLPGRQTTDFTVGGISSVPAVKTAVPVSGGAATFGDELRYEIVIGNPTGFVLVGMEFIDTIPTNTTLVEGSVSIPGGAQLVSTSPTLRVTGINMEPFSQVKISFNVRIAEELASGVDSIVNQGTVLFDSDGDGSNDMWTLTDWNSALPGKQPTVTTITCPVVEITDVSVLETVECEGEIEYLVTYTNVSAATARDVVITSVYDFKVEYRSASVEPDQGTNNTWTIGTLAPGQSGNIRIKVKVVYRLPFLHMVEHSVVLTTNCDTRQAGARTQVLGCGPR